MSGSVGPTPSTPSTTGFALFDTPIGCCAIAWRDTRIIGAGLPEASPDRLRSRMAGRFGVAEGALPTFVQEAVSGIISLLSGEPTDLSFIDVDLDQTGEFEQLVYAAARAIPPGETVTYGELAARIGVPRGARAVGRALGRNPCPIIVPCHRILAGDGKSGGFSAPGGAETKLRILDIEGARRGSQPQLFDRLGWATKPRVSPPRNDPPNPVR